MQTKFITLLALVACATSAPFDLSASGFESQIITSSPISSQVIQLSATLTTAPSATPVRRDIEDELPSSLKHIAVPLQEIIDKMDVDVPSPITSITPSKSFATPIVTPTQPPVTIITTPSLSTSAAASTITAPPTLRAVHRRHIDFNPMGRILSAIYGDKLKSENMAEEEDEEEDEWDEWTAQPTKTAEADNTAALQKALKGAAKELAAASAALIEVLTALDHETIPSHKSGSDDEDDKNNDHNAKASSVTFTAPGGRTTVLPKEIEKQIEDSL